MTAKTAPIAPPASWAAMNADADAGAIPAQVLVRVRPVRGGDKALAQIPGS